MKIKLSSTAQLVCFLGIYALLAVTFKLINPKPDWDILYHLAVTLGSTLLSFGFFAAITKKKKDLANSLITGLILFLLLQPVGDIYGLLFAAALPFIAVAQKFLLNYRGSPVINPVIFSIIVLSLPLNLIFPEHLPFISWWGTAFSGPWDLNFTLPTLILMAFWLILGLPKWRKLPAFLSFLICHALILGIILNLREQGYGLLEYSFLRDSTLYFFAGIMLIEPKSSPALTGQQVIYGLVAALFYNLGMQLPSEWMKYLPGTFYSLSILAANLSFLAMRRAMLRPKLTPPSNPASPSQA